MFTIHQTQNLEAVEAVVSASRPGSLLNIRRKVKCEDCAATFVNVLIRVNV